MCPSTLCANDVLRDSDIQVLPSQNDLSIRLALLVTPVPAFQHTDQVTMTVEIGDLLDLLKGPRVICNLQVHAHLHGGHVTVVPNIPVASIESYCEEGSSHVPLLMMIRSGLKAVRRGRRRSSTAFRKSTRPPSPSCRRLLFLKGTAHPYCSVSHSGCSGWL